MGTILKIWFCFCFFLAQIWPYHLNIARCKTSVDLLLYGISIDFLTRRSWKELENSFCTHTQMDGLMEGWTNGVNRQTRPNTTRTVPKSFEMVGD